MSWLDLVPAALTEPGLRLLFSMNDMTVLNASLASTLSTTPEPEPKPKLHEPCHSHLLDSVADKLKALQEKHCLTPKALEIVFDTHDILKDPQDWLLAHPRRLLARSHSAPRRSRKKLRGKVEKPRANSGLCLASLGAALSLPFHAASAASIHARQPRSAGASSEPQAQAYTSGTTPLAECAPIPELEPVSGSYVGSDFALAPSAQMQAALAAAIVSQSPDELTLHSGLDSVSDLTGLLSPSLAITADHSPLAGQSPLDWEDYLSLFPSPQATYEEPVMGNMDPDFLKWESEIQGSDFQSVL